MPPPTLPLNTPSLSVACSETITIRELEDAPEFHEDLEDMNFGQVPFTDTGNTSIMRVIINICVYNLSKNY